MHPAASRSSLPESRTIPRPSNSASAPQPRASVLTRAPAAIKVGARGRILPGVGHDARHARSAARGGVDLKRATAAPLRYCICVSPWPAAFGLGQSPPPSRRPRGAARERVSENLTKTCPGPAYSPASIAATHRPVRRPWRCPVSRIATLGNSSSGLLLAGERSALASARLQGTPRLRRCGA